MEIGQRNDSSTYVCLYFFFFFRKSDKDPRASNATSNYNVYMYFRKQLK